MNNERNIALSDEMRQTLQDGIQDKCIDCPINGINGANSLEIIFDAKYGRRSEEEVKEAAVNQIKFVNASCSLGATAARQAGCFPSGLNCNQGRYI